MPPANKYFVFCTTFEPRMMILILVNRFKPEVVFTTVRSKVVVIVLVVLCVALWLLAVVLFLCHVLCLCFVDPV